MRQKEKLEQVIQELGLTVRAEFVPWSRSRNFKAGEHKLPSTDVLSLNWRVTLVYHDRDVLTTDYMAGIGHCPAYKAAVGSKTSIYNTEAIAYECEHGKQARRLLGSITGGQPILLGMADVIWSLVGDSAVLNYSTFEDWASELGYESDSRKAEGIYRSCLEIALRLRNAIGDAGLKALSQACEDY